jgi:alanyl-tRNA synthetase
VIRFADSVELCGGTHAPSTGQLGVFKITVETAIAAGIRRIEAVVGEAAQKYIWNQLDFLNQIEQKVSTGGDTMKQLDTLLDENQRLKKQIEQFQKQAARQLKSELKAKIIDNKGIQILAELVHVDEAGMLKDIAFQLKGEIQSLALVLGAEIEGKAHIAVMFADSLVADKGLNAGQTVKAIAKHIQGGGGGQAFFATAGGQNPKGLPQAIEEFKKMLMN